MTVEELLREVSAALPARPGLPDPRREARFLVARALGVDEAWRVAHGDEPVPADAAATVRGWAARRAAGEPAHYILGSCPFFGREFAVTPAVLIPRPETELLVVRLLALDLAAGARVVDVGTGSGCVAISVALARPELCVLATDVSGAALAVARANAGRHAADVRFCAGDLARHLRGSFDAVVANLPYVPEGDRPGLSPEVRDWEPAAALFAGADGLVAVRRLVADAPRLLRPGGRVLLEIGAGQEPAVGAAFVAAGLDVEAPEVDVAGVPRIVVARRRTAGAA